MERPTIIYLDEPVFIKDTRIKYTPEGVEYLLDHYRQVQKTEAHQKQSFQIREFLALSISNFEYYKFLYDNQH